MKHQPGVIVAHTDGACSGNPGPAGSGVVLEYGPYRRELSLYLGRATNNIAELKAIEAALRAIRRRDVPVVVATDSTYAERVLRGEYRARANRELVARIRRLLDEFDDVTLMHVRGHAGHVENERADELARQAVARRRSAAWRVDASGVRLEEPVDPAIARICRT